ncbi:hypothetical protein MUP95_01750 [bacterium]|nr:hypothetical protein [bacterium]
MYNIIYKSILKPGKKCVDFAQWIKKYWPMQKNWGAISYKYWNTDQENKHILHCSYHIKSLDRWNQCTIQPEAEPAIIALSKIIDIDQMSMKICSSPIEESNEYTETGILLNRGIYLSE